MSNYVRDAGSPKPTTPASLTTRVIRHDSTITSSQTGEGPKRRTWALHNKLTAGGARIATVDLHGLNSHDESDDAGEEKECEGDDAPSATVARYQGSVHETYYKCQMVTQNSQGEKASQSSVE
jgi:hypothetical protein